MRSATAILYFARTPENDLKKGQFENERIHTRLISGLNKKTRQAIRASGIPAIVIDERLQRGNSFAERLTHALQTVFEKGYAHVIAVGNDCPDLGSDHLLRAKDLLESGVNVLGPAMDGGDYLIGIRKSSFQRDAFSAAFAQKAEVHKTLMSVLTDVKSQPVELEILSDIDDAESLHFWFKSLRFSRLHWDIIHFIIDLLKVKLFHAYQLILCEVRPVPYHMPHRGPPSHSS